MKRTHDKLADSDDDMDNLPLKYISSDHKKVQSIKELKMFSVHACEFCDKSFKNMYDYFIHNATHIIIPLIKMLPHHCSECGIYCISEGELKEHMSIKHKTIIEPETFHSCKTKIKDRLQFEVEDIKEEPNEDERPLKFLIQEDIVKKEPENILQNFMMNCKVDVEQFLPPELFQSDDDFNRSNIMDACENDYINLADYKFSLAHNHITEIGEDSLINNLGLKTSAYNNAIKIKCEVDNFRNPTADADPSSDLSDLDDDPIILLPPTKKEVKSECVYDSIHFDDLMKPGIFYCRRCFKRFPNRFEVIIHEATHLYLSKTSPEGQKCLTRTVSHEKHSKSIVPIASGPSTLRCERCNDEISDEKLHAKICFRMFCSICAKAFNDRVYLTAHEEKCNGDAIVNMCDKCLYIKQKPKHIQYLDIMRCNKTGLKHTCHRCGKVYDQMSLVSISSKERLKDRIRFEGEERDGQVPELSVKKVIKEVKKRKETNQYPGLPTKILSNPKVKKRRNRTKQHPGRPKILSNRERLKLIQQRLKLMKK